MQIGIWQILVIAIVILVLFGRGRISDMMGDFGKGISSFKKGMSEGENEHSASEKSEPVPPKRLEGPKTVSHDAKPANETVSESRTGEHADRRS